MAQKKPVVDLNTVIIAGLAVGGYLVIKKVLVTLGLAGGRGEKEVTQELQDPGSPWKPAFYKNKPGALILTRAAAEDYAKRIYDALNWYADDTAAVNAVFNELKTKTQVSFLAEVFMQKYNQDLLTYLQEGSDVFPWNGLGDDELRRITNLVDRLPQSKVR